MSKPSGSIILDGAVGEGGGQILRTGLALSAITGLPAEIINIRARRSKPGLAAQHLTGVRAVAAACDGRLDGDFIGSSRVTLNPGEIRAGEYELDIADERPSAGSVTLVMQAMLPVLALADGPSRVVLKGGTHVEWSPSVHYLEQVLRPALVALGVHFQVRLHSWGARGRCDRGRGRRQGRDEQSRLDGKRIFAVDHRSLGRVQPAVSYRRAPGTVRPRHAGRRAGRGAR